MPHFSYIAHHSQLVASAWMSFPLTASSYCRLHMIWCGKWYFTQHSPFPHSQTSLTQVRLLMIIFCLVENITAFNLPWLQSHICWHLSRHRSAKTLRQHCMTVCTSIWHACCRSLSNCLIFQCTIKQWLLKQWSLSLLVLVQPYF